MKNYSFLYWKKIEKGSFEIKIEILENLEMEF